MFVLYKSASITRRDRVIASNQLQVLVTYGMTFGRVPLVVFLFWRPKEDQISISSHGHMVKH